ncbi:GNAT family N-acetyltransferase [Streptococcus sp. X16XC17]|uniref:GNAT family N-acetyltransferase n=1 Tax=unclassified Streptococcus TaxID=2608887 RepID=UPI00066FE4C8|nr:MULTISPECIES: GNAT family N-acetyltransferase [unclassified Streptococcus]TCD45674.1 GNAT family N-acetyltransferase [Streptococcus sp. X16XC17]
MLILKIAERTDVEQLLEMQKLAFHSLYEKYRDEGSPYLESVERINEKLERPLSHYWWIELEQEKIGYLRVQTNEKAEEAWLGVIAVLPNYQGNGYAKAAIRMFEKSYPSVTKWTLATIFQEESLVAFYSSLGYVKTGELETIQPGMGLIYMQKEIVTS